MEWKTIESAPRDGTPILVFDSKPMRDATIFVVAWDDEEHAWISVACIDQYLVAVKPTHWMPLPPPPSQEPSHD